MWVRVKFVVTQEQILMWNYGARMLRKKMRKHRTTEIVK